MNLAGVQRDMSRHYERKWRHHDGYWLDAYAPSQRIYAASLYERRNATICAAVPDGLEATLDIGCGVGDLMLLLAHKSAAVYGVDIAEINVQQCRKNLFRSGVKTATVVQAPAEALPFESGHFDLVVMADVVEHIPDVRAVLAEAKRVLRPGGTFICVTPHRGCLRMISVVDRCLRLPVLAINALRKRRFIVFPHRSSTRQEPAPHRVFEHLFSASELKTQLQRAGFVVESYRRVCFYPGPEGGGVFGIGMSLLHRVIGGRRFARLARGAVRVFGMVEKMNILSQKQMWIAKA